jgi:hypothetical protein
VHSVLGSSQVKLSFTLSSCSAVGIGATAKPTNSDFDSLLATREVESLDAASESPPAAWKLLVAALFSNAQLYSSQPPLAWRDFGGVALGYGSTAFSATAVGRYTGLRKRNATLVISV